MTQILEPNTREYYAELQRLGLLVQRLPEGFLNLDAKVQFSLLESASIMDSLRKLGLIIPLRT
jgi:hypothetical protein